MQLCSWLEQLVDPRPGIDQDSFSYWSGQPKVPENRSGVWVNISMGKFGKCKFNIPISMMVPFINADGNRVLYEIINIMVGKKGNKVERPHINYRMTKGAHRGVTDKSKTGKGTYRFPKKSFSQRVLAVVGGSSGSGSGSGYVSKSSGNIPGSFKKKPEEFIWINCEVLKETVKAILVNYNNMEKWIPKSRIRSDYSVGGGSQKIEVASWVLNK